MCGGADLSLITRLGVSRTALEAMVVVGYYAVMVLQAGLSLALLTVIIIIFENIIVLSKIHKNKAFRH